MSTRTQLAALLANEQVILPPRVLESDAQAFRLALCVAMLSACAIGPDYQRPAAAAPVQYKEAQGWRQANPSDALARGAWWELYADARLNELVAKLNASNQTVAQADAESDWDTRYDLYAQAEQVIRRADQLAHAALVDTERLEERLRDHRL